MVIFCSCESKQLMIVQSGARLKNVSKNVIFDLQKSNFLLALRALQDPPPLQVCLLALTGRAATT